MTILLGGDVLLQKLAVVVQQRRDGVLGQDLVADLGLHDGELLSDVLLRERWRTVRGPLGTGHWTLPLAVALDTGHCHWLWHWTLDTAIGCGTETGYLHQALSGLHSTL